MFLLRKGYVYGPNAAVPLKPQGGSAEHSSHEEARLLEGRPCALVINGEHSGTDAGRTGPGTR